MPGQMESVRRTYGVPARKGTPVVFRGYATPMQGHIISSTGSHLYMRLDHNGQRFGPLHPTWKMDYLDGRDYSAEMDQVVEIRNEWLNGRISTGSCVAQIRKVRERAIAAAETQGGA